MGKDATEYVSSCLMCQQKIHTESSLGLQQPNSPTAAIWEDIAFNFVVYLPT